MALLVSGQSSTFTGTIAGQVILEGFLDIKIPCYQRRLITRGLALGPALVGVLWLGEGSVGRLLVLSQVILTVQLPFALWPLIRFTSDPQAHGRLCQRPLGEGDRLVDLPADRHGECLADLRDPERIGIG